MSEALSPGVDVQASRPRTEVSLTRVGVRGIEKVIKVNGPRGHATDGGSARRAPGRRRRLLLRGAGVLRRPQPAPGRRPHVALRGGGQRRHRRGGARRDPARRGARRPYRGPRSRAAGGPARRGDDRRPLSRDGRDPGLGPSHSGDLHAVWNGGRLRARHPHPDRRRGPGDDRLPLRPGAGQRAALASGWPPKASPTTRSSVCSRPFRWPPTTSAASARFTSAGRRGSSSTWTPATSCTSSSSR